MKILKIYVEAKKSWNFQTYTFGMEVEIDRKDIDEIEVERMKAQNYCRKVVEAEIKRDKT